MRTRQLALLIAVVFSPAISFAQHIFIDSPAQGDTLAGPTTTLRLSVSSDFTVGEDGRILIRVDGVRVVETPTLRATIAIPSGTHQVEAQLVDMRGRPISTALPAQVKVTMDELSD
jgi:hypothetical protein